MKNEQIGEGTAAGIALDKRMITILGPTASGKTDLAAHWQLGLTLKSSVQIAVRSIVAWILVRVKTWLITQLRGMQYLITL